MALNTRPTDLDQTRLQSQLAIYGSMGGDITYDEFKSFTDTGHDEAILANAVKLAELEGLKIGGSLQTYLDTGQAPAAPQDSSAAEGAEPIPEGMVDTPWGPRPFLPDVPGIVDMMVTPPQDWFDAMSLAAEAELRGESAGDSGDDITEAGADENEFDLAAYTKDLIDRVTSSFGNQTITIQNTMDKQLAEQNKIMKQQLAQQERMMIAQRVGQANMDRASKQAQLQFGGQRGDQTGTSGFKRSGGFRAFRPAASIGLSIGGSTTSNANRTINI